jgi:uncharacterized protein (TIGR02679 family)
MNTEADERLRRLVGGETLLDLRRRLRRHFERTHPAAPSGTIRLANVSAQEYEALARLMGRRPRQAQSIQIDLAAIDAAMSRAGIAPSLRAALERLDGPIAHLPTVRAEAAARWVEVARGARHADLAQFLRMPAGIGLLKRLARQDAEAAALLRQRADLVLQRLPVPGRPRAQIAAEALGDAHALDNGEPVGTLVLAVLRQTASPDAEARPETAEEDGSDDSRTLWARAGVLVNELARPALVLNIPLEGGGFLAAAAGEPAYVTLRQLVRAPPRMAATDRTVYVCENPNVVAIAAERLGPRCAPLVSTEGMPAAAQRTLLTQLASAGARLLYHGDFDWAGLRIGNLVMRSFGAAPWRFRAADYAAAAREASGEILTGAPVAASWDAGLAPAMQEHGLAIHEEGLAATLLLNLEE